MLDDRRPDQSRKGAAAPRGVSRRDFLRISSAGGGAALAFGGVPGLMSGWSADAAGADALNGERYPLRMAPEVHPNGLQIVAAPGTADIGGGLRAPVWMLNESIPSPLIRARTGDRFDVRMVNQLPDPLILHWHGITPPEVADGHPRFAVREGRTFRYQFDIENRAGTYWYHSHTHGKVAKHTHRGIGGLFLVEDDEEAALGLPSGEREIPLILQDRRVDAAGLPVYADVNLMEGHVGEVPFGNGVRHPYLEVDTGLYRFRVLNGSNARIFRLERSDGRPMVLIGNDGGLLERPERLTYLDMGPGERADLLLDFSDLRVGEQVSLRSGSFALDGLVIELGAPNIHEVPMELLQIRVVREGREGGRIPETLSVVKGPDPANAVRERSFKFVFLRDPMSRSMETHHINGMQYEMDRIDERVPFGQTEIWSFVNDDWFAHPIHLHATHFRVLSRTGGRGQVMPWEKGLKDTVLVHPKETVRVAVHFDAHPGLFLLHCHNLEHEDLGMMLNIMVG